jgi:hypothetical protein
MSGSVEVDYSMLERVVVQLVNLEISICGRYKLLIYW